MVDIILCAQAVQQHGGRWYILDTRDLLKVINLTTCIVTSDVRAIFKDFPDIVSLYKSIVK